jgi:hypothetical protein
MKTIVLSSGHGLHIRGASSQYGDEVDEARKVVNQVAENLRAKGIETHVVHDNVSHTQNENLEFLVAAHNSYERDFDCSIHFNAFELCTTGMGTECCYLSAKELASEIAGGISLVSGLKNRGAKYRDDLALLNQTTAPAILVEVAFIDSKLDMELYRATFNDLCWSIANTLIGEEETIHDDPDEPPLPPAEHALSPLLTIGSVEILASADKGYCQFTSDLDVCNDGSGDAHGDPYHQPQTAFYNDGEYLNADEDRYVVVPPQIRSKLPGVVMGCQARVTNIKTGVKSAGVIGDIGPEDKTGECAYCLAKILNPGVTYNSGDTEKNYLYELWTDQPAHAGGKTYSLEAA